MYILNAGFIYAIYGNFLFVNFLAAENVTGSCFWQLFQSVTRVVVVIGSRVIT